MLTPQLSKWVEEHLYDDPLKLRLKYRGQSDMEYAILQIECRRKSSSKLRDTLKCKSFEFATALSAEQCTSDLLADFHATMVDEGAKVLDMTGGLGIDVFHIARKASEVDVYELTPAVAEAIANNAIALGLSNVSVHNGDSVNALTAMPDDSFDTIFIDPARRGEGGRRLFALADCLPDVPSILPEMLRVAPKIIVKASPMLDVTQTLRELPHTTHLYIIGTPTECKEIVAVVERGADGSPRLHAVTISQDETVDFEQSLDHSFAKPLTGMPATGDYLYEPWPTVMKAGMMGAIAEAFPSLRKLHDNTHLFTSRERADGFPGDIFVIDEIARYASSEIKALAHRKVKADVSVRNFVISAPDVVKRLKLVCKGPRRLFAATTVEGPVFMLCTPASDPGIDSPVTNVKME